VYREASTGRVDLVIGADCVAWASLAEARRHLAALRDLLTDPRLAALLD
jgi:hypothetical protein